MAEVGVDAAAAGGGGGSGDDAVASRPPVDLSNVKLSEKMMKKAREVFKKHDTDGSNEIEKDEVKGLLSELNLRLSDEMYEKYCIKFFEKADLDHSSSLSMDEFVLLFDAVFAPNFLHGTELRTAAGRGHVSVVRDLVCRGCNPNAGDGRGWSAVHHAAEYGQLEVIRTLQELYGADLDIDADDSVGWTPLFNAASNGNLDVVSHLIASGADVDAADSMGRTALHCAANAGKLEAVSALVAAKANLEIPDQAGWTPLFCAALHQHVPVIRALVEAKANLEHKDRLGNTVAAYCQESTLKELGNLVDSIAERATSPRSPRS